jgi:sulfate adenylyltransferase
MPNSLIPPHGGRLVDPMVDRVAAERLKAESKDWPSWDLTARQLCDIELLMTGGFSPLNGFMNSADYDSVCGSMRLADGTLWPMPITLDISDDVASGLKKGEPLVLRDPEGVMLAVLHVEELWKPDREKESRLVNGTDDPLHPAVRHLLEESHPWCVGGAIEGVQLPKHYDFPTLRPGPAALRSHFARLGWRRVVAFQTRNAMHRAHHEMTIRAAREHEANLLIHPVVGVTQPGDLDHYTRVRCYQAMLSHYPQHTVKLALLPLAMRMAGPREALWHAIIRKNFGCTHIIIGRGHASPSGEFYGPYEGQELVAAHEKELGIKMVPFKTVVYVEDQDAYFPDNAVPDGARVLHISGTDLRRRLSEGREIPRWFTFPDVAAALRRRHPPRHRQGFTIFFTGLSGAGKSTVANALFVKFLEMGGRPVTLLDGDIVRKNLSSELGFSRKDRDINIRRIGFVASEITKNGGIAICAPIAPYDEVRREVREMIEPMGGFVLVHVDTPIDVCEQRDRKGLYAKARAGIIKEFTGVSDPYETPRDADMVLKTTDLTPEQAAQEVLLHLEKERYVGENGGVDVPSR